MGCYGGEIETPNLDSLARDGVRFSNFYNNSRCCPTRASLMTGLPPHRVGIGWMTNPSGTIRGENNPPAYRGYLNRECLTLAEALKPAGYATLMAGKWHLGWGAEDRWPLQRGFEKFYGCLHGTHPFNPSGFKYVSSGNEKVTEFKSTTDRRYHVTDAFTDYAIDFIQEELTGKKRPFFLYLAYTAPHWPVLAHDEDMQKYAGTYDMGWDRLREQRYQRQIELGLIDPRCKLSPRDPKVPAWDSLDAEKQALMSLRMMAYAGMVDQVDQNIGKLINVLKEHQVFENTLILFLSDNGACAEQGVFGRGDPIGDRDTENLNVAYGQCWANASSTPFRLYKHYTHEGGAATPFFMHWPKGIRRQEAWYRESAQVIDVMPTLLEVAHAGYPDTAHGNPLPGLEGLSLVPAFGGKSLMRTEPMFSEHENNAFVIQGKWKLVGEGVAGDSGVVPSKWELYDLETDRTELNNLVDAHPEKAAELAQAWQAWADRAKVYPKPGKKGK
jgi:arylsulfatase A-like enzyme